MPVIHVSDLNDERLSIYRDLRSRKTNSGWSDRFVVESRWVVARLLASRLETISVLCSERELQELAPTLVNHPETPVFVVPSEMMNDLVGFKFHRGQLACAKRPPNAQLSEWTTSTSTLVVACPQITDPVNLAGVIRNCTAFGVDGLLLGPDSADPFSRRTARVSMGTLFKQPIRVTDNLVDDLKQLRRAGFHLSATVLDDRAEPLDRAVRYGKTALLFGSEGPGLSEDLVSLSDRCLTIRMQRDTDSLNVATATGIFLYHFAAFDSE